MARDKVPQLAYVSGMGDGQDAFASLIRDARQRHGWSQDELAEESSVGRRTISRWENGDATTPEAQQVMAVADALGIAREEVFQALGWLTPDEPVGRPDATGPTQAELEEARQLLEEGMRILRRAERRAQADEDQGRAAG